MAQDSGMGINELVDLGSASRSIVNTDRLWLEFLTGEWMGCSDVIPRHGLDELLLSLEGQFLRIPHIREERAVSVLY